MEIKERPLNETLGALHIWSWGLFIGAMGQYAFYWSFAPLPNWTVGALFIPWVTVFTISFCNRPPPISPRAFRGCLLFAMSWYALMTLLTEVLYFLIPPARGPFSALIGRVLMYVFGAGSFLVLVRAWMELRRYESKRES